MKTIIALLVYILLVIFAAWLHCAKHIENPDFVPQLYWLLGSISTMIAFVIAS